MTLDVQFLPARGQMRGDADVVFEQRGTQGRKQKSHQGRSQGRTFSPLGPLAPGNPLRPYENRMAGGGGGGGFAKLCLIDRGVIFVLTSGPWGPGGPGGPCKHLGSAGSRPGCNRPRLSFKSGRGEGFRSGRAVGRAGGRGEVNTHGVAALPQARRRREERRRRRRPQAARLEAERLARQAESWKTGTESGWRT